jgi:hypothetical protein
MRPNLELCLSILKEENEKWTLVYLKHFFTKR